MTEKDFKEEIKNVRLKRSYKVTNSIGNYDIYKDLRKNKWKDIGFSVTEKDFYNVIRTVNSLIADDLVKGKEVILPHNMGSLEVRKIMRNVYIKNGKLKSNLPIDWDATLSLWYKDEEARNQKLLVRVESNLIFKILYSKQRARYTNKKFYSFSFNRKLKQRLTKAIQEDFLDAYLLYNYG